MTLLVEDEERNTCLLMTGEIAVGNAEKNSADIHFKDVFRNSVEKYKVKIDTENDVIMNIILRQLRNDCVALHKAKGEDGYTLVPMWLAKYRKQADEQDVENFLSEKMLQLSDFFETPEEFEKLSNVLKPLFMEWEVAHR